VTAALHVVHVTERLTLGGPLYALAGAARESRGESSHAVISLMRADARAVAHARAAGVEVHSAPAADGQRQLLAAADVVQLHFWNNPSVHAFLASDLPPLRLLVWCLVNGLHAPQVLPRALFERADLVAVSSDASLDAPAFRDAASAQLGFLLAGADFTRVQAPARRAAGAACTIGYVGLVDFVKLHPGFVRICAGVRTPGVRFLACGGGEAHASLEREAQAAGLGERLRLRGQVQDIQTVLAELDVFAYPLCEDTYCTSELMLQEAMAAGLPVVVFPHGGLDRIVEHGRTGLVARDEAQFTQMLERLAADPQERARLGAAAAIEARARFGSSRLVEGMRREYARVMQLPRRARAALPPAEGAQALLRSLDGRGDADLRESMAGGADAAHAEARIAGASANLRSVLLQYRVHYPRDPWLRLWAGLLLLREGRKAPAALEFKSCLGAGLDQPRVHDYFAQALRA
jgi:glycosyltransferase involved in cell wall biosynthesis